jgi:hypothetical protein
MFSNLFNTENIMSAKSKIKANFKGAINSIIKELVLSGLPDSDLG